MTYYDPDFGFLFLKSGWQKARKEALCTPLTCEWEETVIEWVHQATVNEGLRSFLESLRHYGDSDNLNPDAELTESKTRLLTLLTSESTKGLKRQLATLQFHRQNLAVFPEHFFSKHLVATLRQASLDLREELYHNGPTVTYELEPEFFYYAVSREYASELVSHLASALKEQEPHDVDLFLSLAHACATGEAEMFVMDK